MDISNYGIDQVWHVIGLYGELKISKKQLYSFLRKFDGYSAIFSKVSREIDKMEKLRARTIQDTRNLEVVYLVGPAGSGKTTAAKFFAENAGYDYFVTGSGEDILDSYDKEEAIILDDYRATTMRFSEFLKFIDNHTNSSIKSRYNNKDISNCKVMFITSVFEPAKLYKVTNVEDDESNTNEEPLEQLMRRLKHKVYFIENDRIYVQHNDEPKQYFMDMQQIFDYFHIDRTKSDDSSFMDKFKKEPNPEKSLPKDVDISKIDISSEIEEKMKNIDV